MAKKSEDAAVVLKDMGFTRDPRIDESGNYKEKVREISDIDSDENNKSGGRVTDARFSGGVASRNVSNPTVKRYDPI